MNLIILTTCQQEKLNQIMDGENAIQTISELSRNPSSNVNYSAISTTAPIIQENTNIFLSMSNIDNKYANPTSIIHNLVVSGRFGGTILDRPNNLAYNKLIKGQYNQLRIQILGSNLQPLQVNDPDIVIVMIIEENK